MDLMRVETFQATTVGEVAERADVTAKIEKMAGGHSAPEAGR